MSVFRRLLAFGGWCAHQGNQLMIGTYNRSHDRAIRPSWLFVSCGLLALFAAAAGVAAVTAATTGLASTTVAQVAAGGPLQAGSRYVRVSGTPEPGGVQLCNSDGSCQDLVVLTDGAGGHAIFVLTDGPAPNPGPDGTVTFTGLVVDGTSGGRDTSDWQSLVRMRMLTVIPLSLDYLDATWSPANLPLAIAGAIFFAGLDLLIALGWLVGLMPFAALPRTAVAPIETGAGSPLSSVPVGITGVLVDIRGKKRRYRDRPARLDLDRTGASVIISQWVARYRHVATALVPSTEALIEPAGVSGVNRGTGYLVTRTKPAIKMATETGQIILTFKDALTRDRAFAEVAAWAR